MRDDQRFHWAALLGVAAVLLTAAWLAYGFGGPRTTQVFDDVVQTAVPLVAAASCVRFGSRRSTRVRAGWLLLGAAAASWGIGQAVWTYYELVRHVEAPFPSAADVGYLGMIPLGAAAMLAFPTAPSTVASRARALTGALVLGASLLFVSWAALLGPVYRSGTGTPLEQAIGLAYPGGDVVILGIVLFTLGRSPDRRRSPLLLVSGGLLAIVCSDVFFAYQNLKDTYMTGRLVDLGWAAGWLAVGVAATMPSEWGARPSERPSRFEVFLPYSTVLVALGVASYRWHRDATLEPFLFWNAVAIVLLVSTRQLLTLLENISLTHDLQSRIDRSTRELRTSEARFRSLVQNATDVVTILSVDRAITYQSPSVERVFGYPPDDLENTRFDEWLHPDDRARVLAAITDVVDNPGKVIRIESRIRHRSGIWCHVESTVNNLLHETSVNGIVLNTRDVTDRWALEEQLRHQAFHDPLTGLANRALFGNRVQQALDNATGAGHTVAVLIFDVDDFKQINDSLGHPVGDLVLAEIARRLEGYLSHADMIARLSGDEFAILIENGTIERARAVANSVMRALRVPFQMGGDRLQVAASVGIALGTGPTDTVDVLMRNADVAMYTAKAEGKARSRVFEADMYESLMSRLELEAALALAIERQEFVCVYQPIVALESGEITGFEALVRWRSERGLLPPDEFIALAERTGQILQIGPLVLAEAAEQAKLWQQRYKRPLTMSVNVSPRQLEDPALPMHVAAALEVSGLPPGSLTLEITESLLVQDQDWTTDRLRALKEIGVRLAIDDFGVGYSSLGYLQRLPVDVLKIDRSFVRAMSTSPERAALIGTLIEIGRTFKMQTVAEGVETDEEAIMVSELGCELAQGYLFAKPLGATAAEVILSSGRTLAPIAKPQHPAPQTPLASSS